MTTIKTPIKSFQDLEVYSIAHALAMEIFTVTRTFPRDEQYSLTDQIRRSSRSCAVNIAEGWGKRQYENSFKRHLIDSLGSIEETKSWLLFCRDCEYITRELCDILMQKYELLGAKVWTLHTTWKTF